MQTTRSSRKSTDATLADPVFVRLQKEILSKSLPSAAVTTEGDAEAVWNELRSTGLTPFQMVGMILPYLKG